MSAADLLLIPPGGVTRAGLELNIRVATLFIHSWLAEGRGCFALDGRAEDSATAEISRSQVESIIYLAKLNNAQLATMSRGRFQARSHLEHIFWYLTHRFAPLSNFV